MSPRRASLPPPLPPLRARPNSPLRFRSGRDRPACSLPPPAPGGGINTKGKQSKPSTPALPSSQPPPLPPLRARPNSPLRFRSGRDRPGCSLPPPAPGGGINTISKPSKPSTPAQPSSQSPPPPPLRARPSTPLRFRSGPCPSGLLAAPSRSRRGLLITSIHTFGHNYCVSAPPSLGRFFFLCSVIHLATSPRFARVVSRRTPSQRFCGWRTP